ncbi:MAG TPA: beta-propeller fold lactonase family protein [Cyclobacteriaceae bacterium]|nr:beta-propeller fold lactonase family protein [Cyclobacteriaceae bacterium]
MRLPVLLSLLVCIGAYAQPRQPKEPKPIVYNTLGVKSAPDIAPVSMELYARFQHKVAATKNANDKFDININSPKSVNYLPEGGKFYVQSLEGNETVVYDLKSLQKLKVIKHDFNTSNQNLFKDGEYTLFDYEFQFKKASYNIFKGKPVESCFSHNGRFLWVTYYRRSYDPNAVNPSAVAIIDTNTDEIVRVMPAGVLPKMIAASPDNKYVAVTHWGDNTIGIIDIQGEDPFQFKYVKHLIVESRLQLSFGVNEKIDRDVNCGYCLRGTVFTPDSKYLLVGRMGGGGIALFDVDQDFGYKGVTFTNYNNIRHLVISGDDLLVSTNSNGYIQKIPWQKFVEHRLQAGGKVSTLNEGWQNCYVGPGVRTISVSNGGKFIFAAVNEASKIVAVESSSMKVVSEIPADSFPVGMEITDTNDYLLVTAQGKSNAGGGHSVTIYKVTLTQQ